MGCPNVDVWETFIAWDLAWLSQSVSYKDGVQAEKFNLKY